MSNISSKVSGLAVVIIALATCGGVRDAAAEVNISVNLGPPPIVVSEPPEVVLVPGSRVYFVPGVSFDVFYYGGYWWSPRGDRWYRAPAYNGPWRVIGRRYVPRPVYGVPRDYRRVYYRERHIPYGQWKKEHGERGRGHHREHGDRGEGRGRGEGRWEHRGEGRGDHGDHGGGRER